MDFIYGSMDETGGELNKLAEFEEHSSLNMSQKQSFPTMSRTQSERQPVKKQLDPFCKEKLLESEDSDELDDRHSLYFDANKV